MLRKVILLMTVTLLAVSACPAVYADTASVGYSVEEDEKKPLNTTKRRMRTSSAPTITRWT